MNWIINKKTSTSVFLILIIALVGFILWNQFSKELFTVMKVPDFELTNQLNQKISHQSMKGKVYLVEFFYSSCSTICPIMNQNMKYIQNQINHPDFAILSISIDPENDTPETLQNYAKKIGANHLNWHFLTGDKNYIFNLADEFNIFVENNKNTNKNLNHSGMIALVDKNGMLRCRFNEKKQPILYYSGLNYNDRLGKNMSIQGKYHPDREKLIEDIQKLLK